MGGSFFFKNKDFSKKKKKKKDLMMSCHCDVIKCTYHGKVIQGPLYDINVFFNRSSGKKFHPGGPLVFQAGYHPHKRIFKTHPKHIFFRYENRP